MQHKQFSLVQLVRCERGFKQRRKEAALTS